MLWNDVLCWRIWGDLGWNIPVSLAKQVNSQGKNSIGPVIDNKVWIQKLLELLNKVPKKFQFTAKQGSYFTLRRANKKTIFVWDKNFYDKKILTWTKKKLSGTKNSMIALSKAQKMQNKKKIEFLNHNIFFEMLLKVDKTDI